MVEAWGVSRAAKALIPKTSGEKHTKNMLESRSEQLTEGED